MGAPFYELLNALKLALCRVFGTSKPFADVVKLADTPDLGSGAAMREGSSPFIRTILNSLAFCREFARILLLLRARGKG